MGEINKKHIKNFRRKEETFVYFFFGLIILSINNSCKIECVHR